MHPVVICLSKWRCFDNREIYLIWSTYLGTNKQTRVLMARARAGAAAVLNGDWPIFATWVPPASAILFAEPASCNVA